MVVRRDQGQAPLLGEPPRSLGPLARRDHDDLGADVAYRRDLDVRRRLRDDDDARRGDRPGGVGEGQPVVAGRVGDDAAGALLWGEPGDQARIEKSLNEDIPAALDYLEGELPTDGFLFGHIGVADIAIASFFRNGDYAGFTVDAARWPHTAAFVERTLAHSCIADLLSLENVQRNADIKGRRQALLDAGALLTSQTLGAREPRKGMMPL